MATTIIIVCDYWTLIICHEMFPAGHVAAFFILMKTEWCRWWDHPCFLEDGAKFLFWGLGLFWDRLKTMLGTVSGQCQDSYWHMAMALWRLGGTRLLGRGGLVQGSRLGFLKVRAFEQWECCLLRACSCWPRQATWAGMATFWDGDRGVRLPGEGCFIMVTVATMAVHWKSEGEEEEKKRWTRLPIICMVWGPKKMIVSIRCPSVKWGQWNSAYRDMVRTNETEDTEGPHHSQAQTDALIRGCCILEIICSFQRCLPST